MSSEGPQGISGTDETQRDFEDYLQRRTLLPGGREPPAEPPASLDALVLRRAQDAIRTLPLRRPTRRWAVPAAAAAVLVLAISIAIDVGIGPRGNGSGQVSLKRQAAVADTGMAQHTDERAQAALTESAEPSAPGELPRAQAPLAGKPSTERRLGAPSALSAFSTADAARPAVSPPLPADADAAGKAAPAPDPGAWLRRIQALRAQGHAQEADAELRRLRAAFPAYPIALPTSPPGAPH
jgi:hypothetical protein